MASELLGGKKKHPQQQPKQRGCHFTAREDSFSKKRSGLSRDVRRQSPLALQQQRL